MAHVIFKTDPGDAGMFSNLNRIVTYLYFTPNIKKIEWSMYGSNKGCMGYDISGEMFSLIFKDNTNIDDSSILSKNVCLNWGEWTPNRITGNDASLYYGTNRDKLEPYSKTFHRYFKLQDNIKELINSKISELHTGYSDVIGVIVRNSGNNALANEQLKKRMPTQNEYIEAINKVSRLNQRYFFCIDNKEDLDFFKERYPNCYYTNIRRSISKNDSEPHKKTLGSINDLIDTFIEIYLCSSCHTLIHCVTNMATTSLYINMNQVSIPI